MTYLAQWVTQADGEKLFDPDTGERIGRIHPKLTEGGSLLTLLFFEEESSDPHCEQYRLLPVISVNEQKRREHAQAHRGDVIPDSGTPLESRCMYQVVTVGFEPDVLISLREIAHQRGVTVSDLLREGAALVIARDKVCSRDART